MRKIVLVFVLWLVLFEGGKAQITIHPSDTYVKGSMAIGLEVTNSIDFGYNTLIFMEDNLRILFDDTSNSGDFSLNDWGIILNDRTEGGESFFRIDDVTGGLEPFKIMAGSRTNAIVTEGNYVGFGTDDPQQHLHVAYGNTPTIRLEQIFSGNWRAYSWDIAGNESNFFIRDVLTGKQPFKIRPGQDSNVLTLRDNNVGIGTWEPSAPLHLIGYMRFEPQDAAPDNPGAGDLYFDKTSSELKAYDGTNWLSLGMNTDSQELSLSSDILSISGGVSTIDLSGYLDNTDSQTLNLSDDNLLSVSNGNSVDLSFYLDNTDSQELFVSSNVLSISKGTNTIDLSAYLDNTDSQMLSFSGTSLSIDNGNSVDLSTLQDGFEANTDNQELSLSEHVLRITNGTNTFDLSTYLDNTDAQHISFSGTLLSIDNGNSVDLSALQDGYEANTDGQSLSLSGTDLSISGGNTVDLSSVASGADDQELSLSGTTLSIENGNTVDLNSLLENIYNRLDAQESKIEEQESTIAQLQTEVAYLKSLLNNDAETETPTGAMLYQNYPNPSNGATRIDYFLPETVSQASLMIYDLEGRLFKNIPLNNRGEGSVEIAGSELVDGQYLYTLLTDGKRVKTKKMLIVK